MNDHDAARRYKESSVDPHRLLNKLVSKYIRYIVSYVYLIELVYVSMARFCFWRAGIFFSTEMGCINCGWAVVSVMSWELSVMARVVVEGRCLNFFKRPTSI